MIDFNEIRRRLDAVDGFVGGEFYAEYKARPEYNVYNKYDPGSRTLVAPGKKYLLLYQTDDAFMKPAEWLLGRYEKIFSVNNMVVDNPRVVSLPLGVVDVGRSISFALCNKYRDFSAFEALRECRAAFSGAPSRLLYMNYRVPAGLKARRDSLAVKDGLLFGDRRRYVEYFSKNLDHMFVACPEGFGVDSYRFYETLYLGRIPVVLHNPVTDMFRDLPVLFLDKWSDFATESRRFIDEFDIDRYSFEKLGRAYWRKVIG
jgi:hypothetical protein